MGRTSTCHRIFRGLSLDPAPLPYLPTRQPSELTTNYNPDVLAVGVPAIPPHPPPHPTLDVSTSPRVCLDATSGNNTNHHPPSSPPPPAKADGLHPVRRPLPHTQALAARLAAAWPPLSAGPAAAPGPDPNDRPGLAPPPPPQPRRRLHPRCQAPRVGSSRPRDCRQWPSSYLPRGLSS